MKKIIVLVGLILSSSVFACYSDYDCNQFQGQRCLKASSQTSENGICVVPSNQNGERDWSARFNDSATGHRVKSCNFDTDCNWDQKCSKSNPFENNGICLLK